MIATARSGAEIRPLAGRLGDGHAVVHGARAGPRRDRAIDERADVFALGSILCEILTGEPAFTGQTSNAIQRKAARGDLGEALRSWPIALPTAS